MELGLADRRPARLRDGEGGVAHLLQDDGGELAPAARFITGVAYDVDGGCTKSTF
jgi:hypothetical protein